MRAYFRVNIVVLICVVLFLFFTNALAQEGGNPQGWFDRPIPLGVSGGNSQDISRLYCCGGTLGALVEDRDGNLYILSNNHVIARTNKGEPGEDIIQPGLIDQEPVCSQDPYGRVAGLTRFVPLLFKTGTNAVDAAIAEIDIDVDTGMMVDPDGTILDIGPVIPETLEASLDLTVIKSGRTTGKTDGLVSAVDVTVDVAYNKQCGIGTQVARFVNQILIEPGEFSAGGDSGSLILGEQDGEFRPVGLLFAGSPGYTLANPIDAVLESLCVAMAGSTSFPDPSLCTGEGGGGGPPGKKPKPKKVPPGLERASEVKARHEQGLFGIASVVGTGVSFDEVGMPVIEVYMKRATPELVRKIPKALENISLRVVETGTFYAR